MWFQPPPEDPNNFRKYTKDGYRAYVFLVIILLVFLTILLSANIDKSHGAVIICGICILMLLLRLTFAHYAWLKLKQTEQRNRMVDALSASNREGGNRQRNSNNRNARDSSQGVYTISGDVDPPPNYEEVIKDTDHKYFIDVISEIPEVHGNKSGIICKVSLRSYHSENKETTENEIPNTSKEVRLPVEVDDEVPPSYREAIARENSLSNDEKY